jgi:hypothetical protein
MTGKKMETGVSAGLHFFSERYRHPAGHRQTRQAVTGMLGAAVDVPCELAGGVHFILQRFVSLSPRQTRR